MFVRRLGGLYYLLKAATLAWLVLPQTKVGPAAVMKHASHALGDRPLSCSRCS